MKKFDLKIGKKESIMQMEKPTFEYLQPKVTAE